MFVCQGRKHRVKSDTRPLTKGAMKQNAAGKMIPNELAGSTAAWSVLVCSTNSSAGSTTMTATNAVFGLSDRTFCENFPLLVSCGLHQKESNGSPFHVLLQKHTLCQGFGPTRVALVRGIEGTWCFAGTFRPQNTV